MKKNGDINLLSKTWEWLSPNSWTLLSSAARATYFCPNQIESERVITGRDPYLTVVLYFYVRTLTQKVLSRNTDFVSRRRCNFGYSLFTAVTRVVFRRCRINPKLQTMNRKKELDYYCRKTGPTRSKPEQNFKTLPQTWFDPSGAVGDDSGTHPDRGCSLCSVRGHWTSWLRNAKITRYRSLHYASFLLPARRNSGRWSAVFICAHLMGGNKGLEWGWVEVESWWTAKKRRMRSCRIKMCRKLTDADTLHKEIWLTAAVWSRYAPLRSRFPFTSRHFLLQLFPPFTYRRIIRTLSFFQAIFYPPACLSSPHI